MSTMNHSPSKLKHQRNFAEYNVAFFSNNNEQVNNKKMSKYCKAMVELLMDGTCERKQRHRMQIDR